MDRGLVDKQFFNQNPLLAPAELSDLRFDEITENGRVKGYEALRAETGILFTPATYMRLATAIRNFFAENRNINAEKTGAAVNIFFGSYKKGSRKVRKVMIQHRANKIEMIRNASVITFHLNNGLAIENEITTRNLVSDWAVHFYSNGMREFAFKFLNNTLPLKIRQFHYIQGLTRGCTFCEIKTFMPAPDETARHLFFDCPTVTYWRNKIITDYLGRAGPRLTEPEFWLGRLTNELDKNDYLRYIKWIYLYTIWGYRTRKKIPSWLTFNEELTVALKRGLIVSPLLQLKRLMFYNQFLQIPAPERG